MGFLPQHLADRADAALGGEITTGTSVLRGEQIFTGEAADYPRDWADFVGQVHAIEQLRVKIASAMARKTRLDHTLFAAGAHGIGKTTLAYMVAHHLECGLVVTAAPITAEEFRDLVMPMSDGDVVFVDEIHRLTASGQNKADWLLPWMLGAGIKTSRGTEKTPDVTLFGATTDVGRLPATLISRFMNAPRLDEYDLDEATLIVGNLAGRMGVELDQEFWPDVAFAADNNPRAIRRILTHVRDLAHAFPETHPNLERAFEYAGLSADGLSDLARKMLIVLATKRNHTASIATISSELGEPGPLRHHEAALLKRGLIDIIGQGRTLTTAGMARVRQEIR